jgi:hypothetical protein
MNSYLDAKKLAIEDAVLEAERFLIKARVALEDIEEESKKDRPRYQISSVAAAKRSSMDLTRSLVFVRR